MRLDVFAKFLSEEWDFWSFLDFVTAQSALLQVSWYGYGGMFCSDAQGESPWRGVLNLDGLAPVNLQLIYLLHTRWHPHASPLTPT